MNVKPVAPPPDLKEFLKNRPNFPAEQLLQYAGQYIAWNLEGTAIVASAPDELALNERLLSLGIDPSQVVGSYVDPL